MGTLADTLGCGGRVGPVSPRHQRARSRSTDRAAPLGPIVRYRSKTLIMVSAPNRICGLRWIYESDANHVSAVVTRVPSPIMHSNAASTNTHGTMAMPIGSVTCIQIDQSCEPRA